MFSTPDAGGDPTMVRATFQLTRGMGPEREQRLWRTDVRDWSHLEGTAVEAAVVPQPVRPALLAAVERAEVALDTGDLPALARALPRREHWRLYAAFAERAVFLDIETDFEDGITVIGLLDSGGPRLLLAGRDLDLLPELVPPSALLVTFNGAVFDVPHLRQAFPDWQPPAAHVDLRPLWVRLGHGGGLKRIEVANGLGRPEHLQHLDGSRAAWLWRHAQHGSRQALRLLAEYNLHDAINLRPLLDLAYNQLAAAAGFSTARAVSYRGDVLYDVSKLLLSL